MGEWVGKTVQLSTDSRRGKATSFKCRDRGESDAPNMPGGKLASPQAGQPTHQNAGLLGTKDWVRGQRQPDPNLPGGQRLPIPGQNESTYIHQPDGAS